VFQINDDHITAVIFLYKTNWSCHGSLQPLYKSVFFRHSHIHCLRKLTREISTSSLECLFYWS